MALASLVITNNALALFPLGETLVTFMAADDSGNTSSFTATVTIVDTTPPTAVTQDIAIPLDASGNANITAADVDRGSTDIVGIADLSVSPSLFTSANIGPNTVTLTVSDTSGNVATAEAVVVVIGFDFGDAPSAAQSGFAGTYPVTLAEDGARHTIVNGVRLGADLDVEGDGQRNADATGDDVLDGRDDEDGVVFDALIVGTTGSASIDVQGETGQVVVWIDFNRDGVWDNAAERVYDAELPAGTHRIVFTVPADATLGITYARARVATNPAELANPTCAAGDGEVEDYAAEIQLPPTVQFASANRDGVVSSLDALVLINYLTAGPGPDSPFAEIPVFGSAQVVEEIAREPGATTTRGSRDVDDLMSSDLDWIGQWNEDDFMPGNLT